jgi:hypothetical protein
LAGARILPSPSTSPEIDIADQFVAAASQFAEQRQFALETKQFLYLTMSVPPSVKKTGATEAAYHSG